MNYWMNTIINRLETAYQTRFDMKASLVFLKQWMRIQQTNAKNF